MSRHCRKKRKPIPEPKINKVPLYWRIWVNIETPLKEIGFAVFYMLIVSTPLIASWLVWLNFFRF